MEISWQARWSWHIPVICSCTQTHFKSRSWRTCDRVICDWIPPQTAGSSERSSSFPPQVQKWFRCQHICYYQQTRQNPNLKTAMRHHFPFLPAIWWLKAHTNAQNQRCFLSLRLLTHARFSSKIVKNRNSITLTKIAKHIQHKTVVTSN